MLNKKPLERITPSEAGLSSKVLTDFVTQLDKMSEMHSIMIAKGGKVCLEGWWHPYSAQLNHCLWSQSKSYTITAIGILVDEGKLDINEKVCDVLKKYMPENMNDDLKSMTVRDLMTMRSGQHGDQSRVHPQWEKNFFSGEFYGTGKDFGYSGICSSLLGVIVKEKTGLGLIEFLREKVFDKIGIDSDSIKCMTHQDGIEYGGGGFMTKTEDGLRLGLLYANGGTWDGARVLSESWVNEATSKQVETTNDYTIDTGCGYGYQIWMCKPKGVYRFDGAFGQYVIVDKSRDIVIAITQSGGRQEELDVIWKYLEQIEGSTPAFDEELTYKLQRLTLPAVKCAPLTKVVDSLSGKTYSFSENGWYIFNPMLATFSYKIPKGVDKMTFTHKAGELTIDMIYGNKPYTLHVSLDGTDRLSELFIADDVPSLSYASAYCTDDSTLQINIRFIEGAFTTDNVIKLCESSKLRLCLAENKTQNAHGPAPKEDFIESM